MNEKEWRKRTIETSLNDDRYGQAKKAFGKSLDFVLETAGQQLDLARIFSRDELVIVDVGSGRMTYSPAFWEWASARHTNPKILAVDFDYLKLRPSFPSFVPIIPIPGMIEHAWGELVSRHKVTKIDLLTMFNPNLRHYLPDPTGLGELITDTPLVVACHNDNKTDGGADEEARMACRALHRYGYRTLVTKRNPYSAEIMSGLSTFSFDPLILAVSSSRQQKAELKHF